MYLSWVQVSVLRQRAGSDGLLPDLGAWPALDTLESYRDPATKQFTFRLRWPASPSAAPDIHRLPVP